MKFFKSTAIVAALFSILSCNQQNDKAPVQGLALKETATEPVTNTPITKDENKQSAENSDVFNDEDKDKQQPPGEKKYDDKQKKQPITDPAPKPDWDKKIIKTASINLEVKDYNAYYGSLREKIRTMGGYVAQEEQTSSEYKIENTMTIKVPVDQFDNGMALLTTNVEKINERKVSSQDVTMEVVDTKSRIEAKKQVRQRYMDLLAQAKNMEEILNVQSEINGVQEQIESAAGRIEYLTHSSVFSTINLTYYQVLDVAAKEKDKVKAHSFGEKIKDAFSAGWNIVSDLFIGIISIWPLLLATFFAFVVYKKLRTRKVKQTT